MKKRGRRIVFKIRQNDNLFKREQDKLTKKARPNRVENK